jgi:hypothetical protein
MYSFIRFLGPNRGVLEIGCNTRPEWGQGKLRGELWETGQMADEEFRAVQEKPMD